MDVCLHCGIERIYNNFLQQIRLPSGSQKNTFGKHYTLVDSQIHGEYSEQRFNSVCHCISKLCNSCNMGIHIRQSLNSRVTDVTLIRLIACTGQSITQANTSAATGCIIHAYLKSLIMGQQLVCSGYIQL